MCNISIIIPVYNASSFLHKCMESIFAQSVTDIEIILINDGSKDNSLEICSRYADLDSRVKVFDKPNGGVSSARNHGIERASGEYLMFVDSDDWLAPDALETCMPYIPEYDIVRFSASAIYPDKERKYKLGRSDDRKKILKDIVARKTIVACWGALFRKKLFMENNIRFDETLNIGEDWLVTTLLTQCCSNIKLLPDSFGYNYNKTNESSCTLTLNTEKILTQFRAYNMIRSTIPEGYDAEFSFTKCLFIQELIDNCGIKASKKLLREAGVKLSFYDLVHALIANISIRKKFMLTRYYFLKKA